MSNKIASQIMTKAVVTASPDMTLKDAIRLLLRHHISGMPVVDSGTKLVGIITEKDVINSTFSGNAVWTKVEEVMTKDLIYFDADADILKIADSLITKGIRRVPILQEGKVVGIISRRDILREILNI